MSVLPPPLKPFFELAARVGLLLLLYVALDHVLRRATRLPEAAYERPVIALGLIEQVAQSPLFLLLVVGVLLLRRQVLRQRWEDFELGAPLRWLVMLIVAVNTWQWSTYDFNFYFDHGHYLDRALVIGLAGAIWWRPSFVLPYLAMSYAIAWQLDHPLTGQDWAGLDDRNSFSVPFRALTLFLATSLLPKSSGDRSSLYVFVLLCLVASSYWASGLAKLRGGWLVDSHLEHLIPGSYTNGWFGFLELDQVTWLTQFIAPFALPLMIVTVLLECGALLILLRRSVTVMLLVALNLFLHVGSLLLIGTFFWQWIVINSGLSVFLLTQRTQPLYSPGHLLLSLLLIVSSPYWLRPQVLFWYDSRLSITYRFSGVDESGAEHPLPNALFSPYDNIFGQGDFRFLSPDPQLSFSWGLTFDRAISADLYRARSADDILALERKYPTLYLDEDKSRELEGFIRKFVGHVNQRGSTRTWLGALRPPPANFVGPAYRGAFAPLPITSVIIYQNTWFYDDERLSRIRREAVRRIEIPGVEQLQVTLRGSGGGCERTVAAHRVGHHLVEVHRSLVPVGCEAAAIIRPTSPLLHAPASDLVLGVHREAPFADLIARGAIGLVHGRVTDVVQPLVEDAAVHCDRFEEVELPVRGIGLDEHIGKDRGNEHLFRDRQRG